MLHSACILPQAILVMTHQACWLSVPALVKTICIRAQGRDKYTTLQYNTFAVCMCWKFAHCWECRV